MIRDEVDLGLLCAQRTLQWIVAIIGNHLNQICFSVCKPPLGPFQSRRFTVQKWKKQRLEKKTLALAYFH